MTRPAPRLAAGEAGFTLLELIVVLAIVAAATLLALPSAERSRRGLTVATTAAELAATLNAARAEAVRSNREQRVTIDLAGRRFHVEGLGTGHTLPREIGVTYTVPAGEQADAGLAFFRFRPDGSSSGGEIRLATARQSARLEVDWLTGRTRIAWGQR